MEQSKHSRIVSVLAVGALVLLGVGLRCLSLNDEAAWCDESLTTICFPADSFGEFMGCVVEEDGIPRMAPLYYCVQYAWSLVFGGSLLALRYLSVFLFAVAAIQLYFLVNAIGGRRAGLWAIFFFSVSLFEIYYGQEVRFYSLMNVFALAGMHGALWYIQGRRVAGLTLAFVGNAALVGTHVFGFTFVLAQGFYMLRYVRRPRLLLPWWGAHGVMAFGLLGWLAWLGYDFGEKSMVFHDYTAGWEELANTFVQFCGGRFSNLNPVPYMPGGVSVDLIIAAVALVLLGAIVVRVWWVRKGPIESGEMALLVVCLIVPIAVLYVVGRLWRPCFFTRYVIFSALPLYALLGLSIATIPQTALRRTICVFVVGLFAWQVLAMPRPFRADYGAVTRAVIADRSESRMVLVLKPFNYRAVLFALRNTDVAPELFLGLKEVSRMAATYATEGVSVWVVFNRWRALEDFETHMDTAGMKTQRFDSAGMPPLTLYHITAPGAAEQ